MFSWHAIPFVRLLVPFCLGIFISLYFPIGYLQVLIALSIAIFIFLFLSFSKKSNALFRSQFYVGITITMVMGCLGYLRTFFNNELNQPNHFSDIPKSKYLELVVDDGVIEKSKFYRCYAKVIYVLDSNQNLKSSNGSLLLYLRKGGVIKKPEVGNHYLVKANYLSVQAPANPEEFNYKQYLSYHNIYHQLFTDSMNCRKSELSSSSLYQYASQWRDKILLIIKKNISGLKEAGVAEALLMGYKDDLDPDITSAFMRTGTLHVLAVSGMHAGIIYLILAFLTAPLNSKKWGKILQVVILLLGIWLYAFMTGLSSSVLRASVMFSFIAIGKLMRYQVNIYNNIYSSALILLIYNPRFIVDVGFQLSYLAVLGIVFIQPMIQKWFQPKYWLDKYVWSLISVSIAAQLLTFPIGIFYFHQFPNYFILSNLLIIPITSIILVGLILLISLSIIPTVALFLGKLILILIQFNNWLVMGIDKLPYSYVNGINLSVFQMLLLYTIMFLILLFLVNKYTMLLQPILLFLLIFLIGRLIENYQQSRQRIIVVHHIKGHDVYTCIDGKKAYLLSDSGFLANDASIKFFIEPFYWKHGINEIKKCDLKFSFVSTNFNYQKSSGFQFFDRFLTIDKILKKNVQKNGILILKSHQKGIFTNLDSSFKCIKYGANIKFSDKRKIEKDYFEKFGHMLKDSKRFILISL